MIYDRKALRKKRSTEFQEAEVTRVICKKGIMEIQTRVVSGAKIYKYDPPSNEKISSTPVDMVTQLWHF